MPPPPLPIVGIGASAGGLEALERFFRATSAETGAAFVVVQHLSPNFNSMMDELLSRTTSMPVFRAEDGRPLEPNHVYVLPPRKEMTVEGGVLVLTEKARSSELRRPIDVFFRSLAVDAGPRAIGCVLSGTGSDGARGIQEIHDAGGLALCQAPATAKFDGMPNRAIDTEVVDLVAPPEGMNEAIVGYIDLLGKHESLGAPADTGWEARIARILDLLHHSHGIDFSHYKQTTVRRRIERRILLQDAEDIDAYITRLEGDSAELRALYHDLLIGVTRFFRDEATFELLRTEVVPQLVADVPEGEELRAWVAGCATGEEAYSIAMLVHQAFRAAGRRPVAKIFATDIDRASLDFASAGIYSATAMANVSDEQRARYFQPRGECFEISRELRQMVVFAPHDVVADAPFTRLQLVSCRNLLIYLRPETQRKVLSLFLFSLQRNGVLVLGKSENARAFVDEIETVGERERVFRKKRSTPLPADLRVLANPTSTISPARAPFLAPREPRRPVHPPLETYDALLDRFMPPSLLISREGELRHAFNGGADYLRLRDGRPSTGVLDLLAPSLRTAIAGALQRVLRKNEPVTLTGVRVAEDEDVIRVTAEPIAARHDREIHDVLISFAPSHVVDEPRAEPEGAGAEVEVDVGALSTERITALEQELQHTRESLQATIEELETSNEELQASNEELVASNEELQSTNEELQSVNEELYTVNAELQKKIQQLTELANDMDHLLSSMEVGTLFLDEHLRVRKTTKLATELFSLKAQDLGREISDFHHHLEHPSLLEDIRAVVEGTGGDDRLDRDVRDAEGNWYLLRIRPYLVDGERKGVVLTLIDVAALKEAEDRVRRAVVRRDEFLALLSHELRNPLSAIVHAMQILAECDGGSRAGKRALSVIDRQSTQMARLLDDLLDVSRITRNTLTLEREVFDLRETIEEAVEGAVTDDAVGLAVDLSGEPLFVHGDAARLLQVMANLVSNGIRYNRPGGHLEVRGYREGDDVVVRVSDDGIGMSEHLLEVAFEPFVQAERKLGGNDGGMGVGLALVKAIVEMHGGHVRAHSDGPGRGSSFVVSLPAAEPQQPAEVRDETTRRVPARLRVLLVEDNEDSREMLGHLLATQGFEVSTRADGAAALEALREDEFDLVLLDIGLPRLDGYEVARRAREEGCLTRMIALTGYGYARDRKKALQCGFDEHLVKPVTVRGLQQAIARIL